MHHLVKVVFEMLETYITPLLMSYVDKYIRNLKPSDLSLSIWGGDVVLYNLELRLDVLEKELHLPVTFLSGKIHKLQIHVPWTKLLSEPVEITINTIECVIQLKDPSFKKEADNSLHITASEVKKELDKENLHDRAVEIVLKGEEFFDVQLGVTSIMGWTIGDCACYHGNEIDIKSIEEEDELEEKHSESYALQRYGAFFFDYLYTMTIESEEGDSTEESDAVGMDYLGKIKLVREVSHKRIILGPTHLQITTGLLHRMMKIYDFSSDDAPDRKVKDAPFYDEFVEKQLLAGNVPSRYFTITMLSVKLTIPPSNHAEPSAILQSSGRSPDCVSSLHSIHELGKTDNQGFQPALVVMIDRMEMQRNNPMYPTELCKLINANADFPAGKSMLHHAFNNAVIEIFSVEVCLSHTAPEYPDIVVMPATSIILSLKDCILPETWGNETIKRMEGHLEMPSVVLHFSKPHLLLLSHFVASWSATLTQKKEIPILSKTALSKMFDEDGHGSSQSYLDVTITNTDIQCCTTSVVMAMTGSVGSLSIALRSKVDDDQVTTTYLVHGPCNTGNIYSGGLFDAATYQKNPIDSVGPVISVTLQMPYKLEKQDGKNSIGVPHSTKTSNAFLLHVKGIAVCLDPLLYSWISSKPTESSSLTSLKGDRDRKKRTVSLTRTSSIGTPRKKSFARGYAPTTSQKEKKSPEDKSSSKQYDADSVFGSQGFTLETWLFEKLPLITTFAVQVDVRSVTVFTPERHITYVPQALSIPQNFALQRLNTKDSTAFPSTLVLCLPSLELYSTNHRRLSFRPKLPLHLQRQTAKDKGDTLPWTLNAKDMAVYSVHAQSNHTDPENLDSIYYIISPVSCTAVLASAQTSSVTSPVTSSLHHSVPHVHKGESESHRVPTLGFCVHSDFTPVVVSSSRKQITLLANIVETLLHAVIPSSSNDLTTSPATPGRHTAAQRTMSLTSSSAVEHVEKEIGSHSESSSSFTDVNQTVQGVRLSLWLQWTLPRLIIKLFGHTAKGSVPICVTSDLEDLTAFVDYQDTHLQMQYKVGAFGVTHTVKKSDSQWHPGPYGGILFSCKDILSYKTSLLAASPRLPPTGTQHDGPVSNPHGFLTITYNCLNLHFKRRRSHSERPRSDSVPEECFRLQHEVRVAVQPFDVILWTPAVVAAIDVFDARLLDKFHFLSQGSFSTRSTEAEKEDGDNTVLSTNLLPLLFMNMRDIRLFVPCSDVTHNVGDDACLNEDLIVIHLSKVTTTPHPDNPITRSILSKDLYEKYVGFGRSSRRALGYDLHEVQYQTDLTGFGMWAAKWNELCGNLSQQSEVLGSNTVMDQNPALEWNTRMWRSAKEVNISLLLSESDFKVVLAPAVVMEMTLANSKHTKSLSVCGWSVELNVVTDVDCYLNKSQMLLLQILALENTEMVFSCELLSSLGQSNRSDADIKTPIRDVDITDSGLGSSQAEQTKKHEQLVPFEAFFAARKLSVKIYTRRTSSRRRSLHGSPIFTREGSPSRSLSLAIKPVLLIDVVEPAVIFKDHALGPGFQLWCYDVIVMGSQLQQGWLHKSLPEASDFSIKCFHTRPGLPAPNTGVKPSLLTVGATNLANGAGKPPRLNAHLETEGLQVSFVLSGQRYYFVRPFTLKCEVEMVSSPNSLTQISSSVPQICSRINIGLLQIDFGQHHLNFITTTTRVLQQFFAAQFNDTENTTPTDNKNPAAMRESTQATPTDDDHGVSVREEACLDFELVEEEQCNGGTGQGIDDGAQLSFDDLRTGPFRYVTVPGEVGLHPEPYEILFTSDTRDRPPSMVWRYPEPHALVTVEVLPLPFTSPVLVNTLNMGDELRVPCVLSYWDNLQKCYTVYKEFYISEVSSCNISLPDPLTADPSTVIVAEEWQMIIDASIDVDYPDDQSLNDEDGGSSFSSPYRSLISATALAASVKVNSIYHPSLIPAVSAQVSISMLEIKLLNHAPSKQVLPKYLDGYTLDPSVPTEQEFFRLAIEGLSGVAKHLGGSCAATLFNVEWNCHCDVLDYDDLTYQTFLSPFDVSLTTALFHGEAKDPKSQSSVPQRSAWFESSVNVGEVESIISQTAVHTVAVAVDSWTRSTERQDESVMFNHYIICNDTNEDIRLGQVDTEEAILLPSRHVLPYSWRMTRQVKRDSKLHVCFESEGDWRWSEPFNVDSSGVCTRVIHHKLHSASIVVHVMSLSGVQKQVIFRGGLQIASRLSVKVDLQVLKNPSLGLLSAEKSTLQRKPIQCLGATGISVSFVEKPFKCHATSRYTIYCWFARDVMAAMLVPDNKAFLISFSCLYHQPCDVMAAMLDPDNKAFLISFSCLYHQPCDVMAAMLVPDNKAFLISFSCLYHQPCDVMAAMLDPDNKAFLISFSCSYHQPCDVMAAMLDPDNKAFLISFSCLYHQPCDVMAAMLDPDNKAFLIRFSCLYHQPCDVMAAMLVPDNKAFLISFSCLYHQHGRKIVHEDIALSPDTTLPSYVVSHAGLVGMRIRIPGTTTWSEPLPLDHVNNGDDKQQHLIVKLLGVKTFQTFYLWYSMEKTVCDQTQPFSYEWETYGTELRSRSHSRRYLSCAVNYQTQSS
ncbi:hypothetical protein QZH41_018464 [Actinostola sp. cb2023]|nr:hypothetical protein QZH41_018464 [Actinostola sp. cb2023]